jgi:hypothetical protein
MPMMVNHALSICESLFLALNRLFLVSLVGFFRTLLLGLWGLWTGSRGLVFWLWAARIFVPSMGHAQSIKTPLAVHNFTGHPDESFCPVFWGMEGA